MNDLEIDDTPHFADLMSDVAGVATGGATTDDKVGTGWQIDPEHSTASFAVKHMIVSYVRGVLGSVQGNAIYDGKHLSQASVTATIDTTAIDTHNSQRDDDLRSEQFLDTRRYPSISFSSHTFEKTNYGFKVYGHLTLHGVTRPVMLRGTTPTAVVKDPWGNDRFGVSARTKINRQDFGILYKVTIGNGGALVADEVAIQLDVEMTRRAA
jgi:polyisoprenoid-binding protein YceI